MTSREVSVSALMTDSCVHHKLTISPNEAANGTKKILPRKGKRLEVSIPPGVRTGIVLKLTGALQITDGYHGDILIQIKVKSQHRVVLATTVISGLFIVIICSVVIGYFADNSGGGNEPKFTQTRIYENSAMHVGGDNKPIELANNPNAQNPTYTQLISFIKGDTTDSNEYVEEGPGAYVCSDFAEDVHNNAEAAGIRTAWVSIDFVGGGEGHSLNAFETIDRGMVYIDCQNGDAVAYFEIGRKYGTIPLAYARSLSYYFYEDYIQKWQDCETKLKAYNREVSRFNQQVSGKIYYEGSSESARMEVWEVELEKKKQVLEELEDRLGDTWVEPLGVVEDVKIHW